LNDPQIIETGDSLINEERCIERVKENGVSAMCIKIEVTPKVICLDAPGSNGCNAGPGDGTVIIVGSAASGDHRSDPQGIGGTDRYGDGDGAGGQGGL
jgi:hypothetical protein